MLRVFAHRLHTTAHPSVILLYHVIMPSINEFESALRCLHASAHTNCHHLSDTRCCFQVGFGNSCSFQEFTKEGRQECFPEHVLVRTALSSRKDFLLGGTPENLLERLCASAGYKKLPLASCEDQHAAARVHAVSRHLRSDPVQYLRYLGYRSHIDWALATRIPYRIKEC